MINCIKYEVCGQKENVVLPDVSAKFLTELYTLSKAHDAAHLVGAALEKSGVILDFEKKNNIDNQVFNAFMHGGCGVKPFVDLWVLEHKVEHSDEKRKELLSRGGLEKFAEAARALSKVWFEDGEHTDVTKELENFVLSGGVYGTLENSVSVGQSKKGGKIKYILSRVWLSYDVLKIQYPNLEKHKWLLPFYEVKRWLRLLFKGGVKRSVNEIKVTANMDSEKVERSARLMSELGLIERKK